MDRKMAAVSGFVHPLNELSTASNLFGLVISDQKLVVAVFAQHPFHDDVFA
jgi:hypothetical protein